MNERLEDVAFVKDRPKDLWVLLLVYSRVAFLSELSPGEPLGWGEVHGGPRAVLRPGKGPGFWNRGVRLREVRGGKVGLGELEPRTARKQEGCVEPSGPRLSFSRRGN